MCLDGGSDVDGGSLLDRGPRNFLCGKLLLEICIEGVLLGSLLISCEKHFPDHVTHNFELAMKVLHIMFRNKVCHQNNVSIS